MPLPFRLQLHIALYRLSEHHVVERKLKIKTPKISERLSFHSLVLETHHKISRQNLLPAFSWISCWKVAGRSSQTTSFVARVLFVRGSRDTNFLFRWKICKWPNVLLIKKTFSFIVKNASLNCEVERTKKNHKTYFSTSDSRVDIAENISAPKWTKWKCSKSFMEKS